MHKRFAVDSFQQKEILKINQEPSKEMTEVSLKTQQEAIWNLSKEECIRNQRTSHQEDKMSQRKLAVLLKLLLEVFKDLLITLWVIVLIRSEQLLMLQVKVSFCIIVNWLMELALHLKYLDIEVTAGYLPIRMPLRVKCTFSNSTTVNILSGCCKN